MPAWVTRASAGAPAVLQFPSSHDGGSMKGPHDEYVHTWHYFVSGYSRSVTQGAEELKLWGKEVHTLFHPITGQLAQILPGDRAARGLRNPPGGVETNRRGGVHIQCEVIANSPDWWKDLTPAGLIGLKHYMDWLRSLGIPDQWACDSGPGPRQMPTGRSGHCGHVDWKENSHTDYIRKAPWEIVGGSDNKPTKPSTKGKYLTLNGMLNKGTVAMTQKFLNTQGNHLVVDGDFGPKTTKAWQSWVIREGAKLKIKLLPKYGADGAWGQESASGLAVVLGLSSKMLQGRTLMRRWQEFLNLQIRTGKI